MKLNELVLKSYGKDKYHIFKNPLPKLQSEILEEVKIFRENNKEVKIGWPEKKWKIVEWGDDEVRLEYKKDVKYEKRSEVEEAQKEALLNHINIKFNIVKYFKEIFGIIYNEHINEKCLNTTIFDMEKYIDICGNDQERNDPTGVDHFSNFYNIKSGKSYEGYEIEISEPSGRSMCIYFDEEGNIHNRDYNQPLQDFVSGQYNMSNALEHLKIQLTKIGNLDRDKNNKFYNNKNMYIIRTNSNGIYIEEIPFHYENKYKKYREKAHVKPVLFTQSNGLDMYEYAISKAPKELLDKLK